MKADDIKREIENRGWDWAVYSHKYCKTGRFRCDIIVPENIALIGQAVADSEQEALRLALQDAVEEMTNA